MAEPDTTVYEQPSVRISTTWTPGLIRAVKRQADGGDLSRVAELCDDLLADDRVGGVMRTLADSVLGVDLGFDDGMRRGRRKRVTGEERSDVILALEDDGDWWAMLPEDEARQFIIWGMLLGCAPGQLVYPEKPDYQRGGRVVPRVEFWHPKHLRWDTRLRKWFIRVGESGTEVEFTPGDGKWVLYAPWGKVRPWAQGLWRGVALLVLLKLYAIDDIGKLGANAARAVATDTEKNRPDPKRRELASALAMAERGAVIALPTGVDLKLLGIGQGTKEVYESQISLANTSIAITVLGQNLTTEVTGGSYAAARMHGQVKGQVITAVAGSVSTWAHDDFLGWYAEYNYGSRQLAPWPVYDTEPPEDQVQAADVLSKVASSIVALKAQGIALDLPNLEQRFNIKFAEEQPAPAPLPAPPPAAPQAPPQPVAPPPEQAPKALLSGAPIMNLAGFVEGQTYADALVDSGTRGATDLMSTTLAELLELTQGVESFEDARAKLLAYYRDAPAPDALAEQTERLFSLAQLAGIAAVNQDAPEARGEPEP